MFGRLQKKKSEMVVKLQEDLKKSPNVAITHDGWTSLNTESYFTTTVHFIDNDWVLKNAVLGTIKMEKIHTSENIAFELKKTQTEWSITEFIATTDNARNEQKAYEILGMSRFGCYGHRINLIVKHALDIPEVGKILGKARKIVTFFHQSSSVSEMLKSKQRLLLDEKLVGHKLVIDVVTRWNSTLYMLRRLLEQYPCLIALANEPSLSKSASTTIKNCVFNFDEHTVVECLVQILDPFEKATTIVCSETTPTIQKVLPMVRKLFLAVEIKEDDTAIIKKVKEKISLEMTKRTKPESISLLGSALNPFAKDLTFLSQKDRETAHKLLRDILMPLNVTLKVENEVDQPQEENPQPQEDNPPKLPFLPTLEDSDSVEEIDACPPSKKKKSVDTDDWLADIICTGVTKVDNSAAAEMELNRYFGCRITESDYNLTLLEWWKKNESYFPRLSQVAKKYLAVPASSVPSERVFSTAGEIVNKKRCRLHFENVDLLIFLNKNLEKYW